MRFGRVAVRPNAKRWDVQQDFIRPLSSATLAWLDDLALMLFTHHLLNEDENNAKIVSDFYGHAKKLLNTAPAGPYAKNLRCITRIDAQHFQEMAQVLDGPTPGNCARPELLDAFKVRYDNAVMTVNLDALKLLQYEMQTVVQPRVSNDKRLMWLLAMLNVRSVLMDYRDIPEVWTLRLPEVISTLSREV